MHKTWYIHTMAYHSALKRKKRLTQAATKMILEDITLNEISQLHEVPGVVRFIEPEGRMVVARGWGRGDGNDYLVDKEFLFGKIKMF